MSRPLRIGILARDPSRFASWELRAFEALAGDPRFEIVAIVADGRPREPRLGQIKKAWKRKRLLSLTLYRLLMAVEGRLFAKHRREAAPTFRAKQDSIPVIRVAPAARGFVDHFSEEDCREVRALDLDVLLRHGFNIIKGDILTAARHGIWSFHHADNRVNRGGPSGFWETYYGQAQTGATLQVLNAELDGGAVIARASFNTHWSAGRNGHFIKEQSVPLLLRELKRLAETGSVAMEPSGVYSERLFRTPSLGHILIYAFRMLRGAGSEAATRLVARLGLRPKMWTLFVGSGPFEKATLWRTVELPPTRNEFWADPFLMTHGGAEYVFFENFCYRRRKGRISVGRLENGRLTYLGDALDLDYHLSYPFVFCDGDDIFMIPETQARKRVEVWRCVEFPLRWELHATALDGASPADTTLFKRGDEWWMFANLAEAPYYDHSTELHVFRVDGPNLRNVVPHRYNPVVIDSASARGGGRIFERDGRAFRPSQNNSRGVYGYGLNLMEIVRLSLDEYEERRAHAVLPNFKPGLIATHHVDVNGDTFVIDACRRIGGRIRG